jgi:serine/threonine protein phosphatase PrpC
MSTQAYYWSLYAVGAFMVILVILCLQWQYLYASDNERKVMAGKTPRPSSRVPSAQANRPLTKDSAASPLGEWCIEICRDKIFCRDKSTGDVGSGYGEDAAGFACASGLDLLVVCDGMGGAGATKYVDEDGTKKTGAYIAARLALEDNKFFFTKLAPLISDCVKAKQYGTPEAIHSLARRYGERLRVYLERSFADKIKRIDGGGRLRGTLLQTLPTTIAGAITFSAGENNLVIWPFWAGDSRTYVFLPEGLRQLTWDDLRGNADPYENLRRDSLMSNNIRADDTFSINIGCKTYKLPCLVIAATDGAFHYLPTPMDFEWLLLDTIHNAATMTGFKDALEGRLTRVAADDISVVIRAYGFSSFDMIRTCYKPRLDKLNLLLGGRATPAENGEDWELDCWNSYKKEYMQDCPRKLENLG